MVITLVAYNFWTTLYICSAVKGNSEINKGNCTIEIVLKLLAVY